MNVFQLLISVLLRSDNSWRIMANLDSTFHSYLSNTLRYLITLILPLYSLSSKLIYSLIIFFLFTLISTTTNIITISPSFQTLFYCFFFICVFRCLCWYINFLWSNRARAWSIRISESILQLLFISLFLGNILFPYVYTINYFGVLLHY